MDIKLNLSFLHCMLPVIICRVDPVKHNATYGSGSGRVVIDELHCHGNESDIVECKSRPWLDSNCVHDEDVGLDCGLYFMFQLYVIRCPNLMSLGTGSIILKINISLTTIGIDRTIRIPHIKINIMINVGILISQVTYFTLSVTM